MDIKDIPQMIASGDQHEIERAYRALVGFPSEEGIDSADAASVLAAFDEVSVALRQDFNIMPRLTCEAARLPGGSTYQDGANDFASNRLWWQGHFNAAFAEH